MNLVVGLFFYGSDVLSVTVSRTGKYCCSNYDILSRASQWKFSHDFNKKF